MKKLVTLFLLVVLVNIANAQYRRKMRFKNEWTLGVSGGTNYYLAEGYQETLNPFSQNPFGSFGRISAAYKFSSLLSLKTTLGMNTYNSEFKKDSVLQFKSQDLLVDLNLNILNCFTQYPEARKFEIFAFVGTGVALRANVIRLSSAIDKPSQIFPIGRAGLQMDFRLTELLILNAIGECNIASDNYNGIVKNAKLDIIPAVSLGLSYRLISGGYVFRNTRSR